MSYCLNPTCQKPQNPDNVQFCQNCGSKIRLGDRYWALKPIGQGGFGRTFLAVDEVGDLPAGTQREQGVRIEDENLELRTQTSNLAVPNSKLKTQNSKPLCVIKQLLVRDLQANPHKAAELFRQEAERLAELRQHPQIPRLLAHFEQDDGQYLVQEFIDGQNLAQVLAIEGTWDEMQIRSLLADLLPVLEFIHARQIIHRDIKPENIICPAPASQLANALALVDFGASKYASDTFLAKTGTVIGSAGYVAPEQAMGRAEFASDLYSLGVTCIHLLTGMHPFDLYSVSEDAWVWRQYLPRPISLELRRVLDKLLQRATRQRYQNASSVLQDLRLGSALVQGMAQINSHVSSRAIANSTQAANQTTAPSAKKRQSTEAQAPSKRATSNRSVKSNQSWHCVQTLVDGEGEVTAIAISPKGDLLASGGIDRAIRLWDLHTGELLHTFAGRSFWRGSGHSDCINALTFSPEGEILISASEDGTVKQWDLVALEGFSTLPGHGWRVSAIALSPDGYVLAVGSGEGTIQIWDLETEKLLATLTQHQDAISALIISRNGQHLMSASADKTICLWNFETDQLLDTLKGHVDRVSALALSPNGRTLISGSWDKTLKIWNLSRGEQVKVIAAHGDRINSLTVHPSGKYFASGSEDNTIKLWDLETGDRLCTLQHAWAVNTIAFSPNGQLLISGSADETIKIWQR